MMSKEEEIVVVEGEVVEKERRLSSCGYCLHCMKNLRSYRVTGKKGRLTCLQKDDFQLMRTHRKIYFGSKYSFFVEKEQGDSSGNVPPTLKSFRVALYQRRNELKRDIVEIEERMETILKENRDIGTDRSEDEFVDTVIRHGHVERVRFDIYTKEFEKQIAQLQVEISNVKIEMHELETYVCNLAAPVVQPVVRGFLQRRENLHRAEEAQRRDNRKAAIVVQTTWRIVLAKRCVERLREKAGLRERRLAACAIQRAARCMMSRADLKLRCEARRQENRFNASVKLQSIWRGSRQRKRFHHKTNIVLRERKDEIMRRAATMIQRFARGLLVRVTFSLSLSLSQTHTLAFSITSPLSNTIIKTLKQQQQQQQKVRMEMHSEKLRNRLHPRLRMYGEKYLQSGRLWEMLLQIDADYKFHDQERQSERSNAVTFVKEVVRDRHKRFTQQRREWAAVAQRALMGPALTSLQLARQTYDHHHGEASTTTSKTPTTTRSPKISSPPSRKSTSSSSKRRGILRLADDAEAVEQSFVTKRKENDRDACFELIKDHYNLHSPNESALRVLTLAALRAWPPNGGFHNWAIKKMSLRKVRVEQKAGMFVFYVCISHSIQLASIIQLRYACNSICGEIEKERYHDCTRYNFSRIYDCFTALGCVRSSYYTRSCCTETFKTCHDKKASPDKSSYDTFL